MLVYMRVTYHLEDVRVVQGGVDGDLALDLSVFDQSERFEVRNCRPN